MKNLSTFLSTKNYFKIIFFLLLSLSIFNCRSSDDEVVVPPVIYPVENPLAAYLTNSGFNTFTNEVNAGYFEFGLSFSPNVKGNINALKVQIPDVNNSVRVTIWDFDTMAVLRTETINVTASNTTITKAIAPLALVANKKYLISMNSNDWYDRRKSPTSPATYPVTAGNITIHSYLWGFGTTQTFPTGTSLSYYAGDLSFDFQQTN